VSRRPRKPRVLAVFRVTRTLGKKATNPCPCGFRGDGTDRCKCSPGRLEHYAGPCEQHVLTFVRPVQTQATLDVSCQCEEGDDQQGTKVEVWGNVMFERPLSMRLMLRNGERSHGPAAMDGKEMVVIPSGTRVPIERQSVTVAVGRRPWISMRVSDGEGRVLCPEHTLGYSMRFW